MSYTSTGRTPTPCPIQDPIPVTATRRGILLLLHCARPVPPVGLVAPTDPLENQIVNTLARITPAPPALAQDSQAKPTPSALVALENSRVLACDRQECIGLMQATSTLRKR